MSRLTSAFGNGLPVTPTPHRNPAGRSPARRAAARLGRRMLGLAGFVVVVVLWQLVAAGQLFGEGLLPTPALVARELLTGLLDGGLLADLVVSSRRVLVGIVLGMAVAVPVGFLLGWFPIMRAMFNPLVNFFRALPPIALVPLVIIYFGIGELARGIVLVYAAFFATIVIVYEGVAGIEERYVRAAQTLGAKRFETLAKVVLPLSVPHILTAARVSLGVGWSSLVAAELVAAREGLGATIQNASNFLDIPRVYAGIILIGASALVMDLVVRLLARRLVRWQDRGNR